MANSFLVLVPHKPGWLNGRSAISLPLSLSKRGGHDQKGKLHVNAPSPVGTLQLVFCISNEILETVRMQDVLRMTNSFLVACATN